VISLLGILQARAGLVWLFGSSKNIKKIAVEGLHTKARLAKGKKFYN
jgi:hypothetical protein